MKFVNGLILISLLWLCHPEMVLPQSDVIPKKINMFEIKIVDFDSVITSDGIELNWYLDQGGISKELEVERSQDNINFESVDWVYGSIIDSETIKFIYYDFNVPQGYYYYRLKCRNESGTTRFTKPVLINANKVLQSALEQNSPNPFNPATTIRFRLATRNKVSLRVYNILGQLVNTLIDGYVDRGIYTLRWDGRDMTGRDIPAGVYFYQILIDRYTETRRMILVR